ncbi:MAG: hypothetical protein A3F11_01200 [Gammaproteobacteria bacterium RIFCSPHIGHO2_12_FULL_37_14]|nr:MAG: hypothetical protein A3F11_01200 [Gammaproteobacteria bacterium RIFCSPHIGHO2_12_FULL_37_14]
MSIMRKIVGLLLVLASWQGQVNAANLLEVYQEAQQSDPIFQQAVSEYYSEIQGVPISAGALLPNIILKMGPSISRAGLSGSTSSLFSQVGTPVFATAQLPPHITQKSFGYDLTIRQVVFDYAKFTRVAEQFSYSKKAEAKLNSAIQNLIIRVTHAYLNILKDTDDLQYSKISRTAFLQDLYQVKQQYKVGKKKVSDLDAAQAAYDSAVVNYLAAENTLDNDIENLRVITGHYYPSLAALNSNIPLISPQPNNINTWVKTAIQQNWSIKASGYAMDASRQIIKKQFARHMPIATLEATYFRNYTNTINRYQNSALGEGPGQQKERVIGLKIAVPIFEGGSVTAETRRAFYNFQTSQQKLEQSMRDTINSTRQSYHGVLLGIRQIKADAQSVRSAQSSLASIEASYKAGTSTLLDVLNQRKKVLEAQTQYAADRYNYINNLLNLKKAAGTLSFDDLHVVNAWLGKTIQIAQANE